MMTSSLHQVSLMLYPQLFISTVNSPTGEYHLGSHHGFTLYVSLHCHNIHRTAKIKPFMMAINNNYQVITGLLPERRYFTHI